MWDKNIRTRGEGEDAKQIFQKVGSLVLGTGTAATGQQSETDRKNYQNIWRIKIDKHSRFSKDRQEAEDMLEIA